MKGESSNHSDRINKKKHRNFGEFDPFGDSREGSRDNSRDGRDGGLLQFDDYPSSSAHKSSGQSSGLTINQPHSSSHHHSSSQHSSNHHPSNHHSSNQHSNHHSGHPPSSSHHSSHHSNNHQHSSKSGHLSSKASNRLLFSSSVPASNSPLYLEDGDPFQANGVQSDDHRFSFRGDRLVDESAGEQPADRTNASEEFRRCFKQLTGEGYDAGQVAKALSIANNRIPFAKEILKQFASSKSSD